MQAQVPSTGTPPRQLQPDKPSDVEELLKNLQDGRDNEKVFAARELRRQVRASISQLYARDEVLVMEAQQALARFDKALAPLCIEAVSDPEVAVLRPICADILGELQTEAALPVLRDVLGETERRRHRRRVQAAIQAIEEAEG